MQTRKLALESLVHLAQFLVELAKRRLHLRRPTMSSRRRHVLQREHSKVATTRRGASATQASAFQTEQLPLWTSAARLSVWALVRDSAGPATRAVVSLVACLTQGGWQSARRLPLSQRAIRGARRAEMPSGWPQSRHCFVSLPRSLCGSGPARHGGEKLVRGQTRHCNSGCAVGLH